MPRVPIDSENSKLLKRVIFACGEPPSVAALKDAKELDKMTTALNKEIHNIRG